MKRFEFAYTCREIASEEFFVVTEFITFKPIPDIKTNKEPIMLKTMGLLGWSLVSVTYIPSGLFWYFQREL